MVGKWLRARDERIRERLALEFIDTFEENINQILVDALALSVIRLGVDHPTTEYIRSKYSAFNTKAKP